MNKNWLNNIIFKIKLYKCLFSITNRLKSVKIVILILKKFMQKLWLYWKIVYENIEKIAKMKTKNHIFALDLNDFNFLWSFEM